MTSIRMKEKKQFHPMTMRSIVRNLITKINSSARKGQNYFLNDKLG